MREPDRPSNFKRPGEHLFTKTDPSDFSLVATTAVEVLLKKRGRDLGRSSGVDFCSGREL